MADEELIVPYADPASSGEIPDNQPLVDPYAADDGSGITSESEKVFLSIFDPSSVGRAAVGIAETAATVTSGLGGMVTAGLTAPLVSDADRGGYTEDVIDAMTYEPRTYAGELGVQGVHAGMGVVVDTLKKSGSGIAGITTGLATGSLEAADRAREGFMSTTQPLGEGVYRTTGSPGLATAAQLLPDIIAMGLGIRNPPKTPTRLRDVGKGVGDDPLMQSIPEGYGVRGKPAETWGSSASEQGLKVEFDKLQAAIKSKDAKAAAEIIRANPAMIAAFEELNIRFEPQMVSENPAVRSTASGMKSGPQGGDLQAADDFVAQRLREAGDELVNKYGSTDRNLVDERLRGKFDEDRTKLEAQEKEAFAEVRAAVPQAETVAATKAIEYIEQRIHDLGGGDIAVGLAEAGKHERQLWNLTHRRVPKKKGDGPEVPDDAWEAKNPSYAALDSYRQQVGKGIKGELFKEADQGHLKVIYGTLADAQQQAANKFGVGERYKAANDLTIERKAGEKSSEVVMGRKLERGALKSIDAAATALTKGSINEFRRMMKNTPESERAMVASAVIDRLMTGAGKGPGMTQGFIQSLKALDRYPGIKNELFGHLPPGIRKRFDTIGTAARGFFRSMEKDNRSNTANANNVLKSIEDGSLFDKLFNTSEKIPIVGGWVEKLRAGGNTKRAQAAEVFLRSKPLEQAIKEYARGKLKRAEKIVTGSAAYNNWLNKLDHETIQQVQKEGVMAFLFGAATENIE